MLNVKKIIASFLTISSSMALAGTIGSSTDEVFIPCENPGWEVGVSALYLKPSFAGNGLGYSTYGSYAGADNFGVVISGNGANPIANVTPRWHFGFALEGAYNFSTGNDVNLNWSHLNDTVNGQLPPGSLFSGSADGLYAGSLNINSQWDAVNLELGKHIQFGQCKLLRLHAGVAYARIKNTITNYPKLLPSSDPYFITTDTISYSGVGPRLGADFSVKVGSGLGVYAKAAGSTFVGSAKQSIAGYRDLISPHYGLVVFGIPNYTSTYHSVVVPELEAKLGVTYDFEIAQGNMGIDLGYLWMNYLSAINTYTGIGIVSSSVGIPGSSNFNLNGVYLKLNWAGC